MFSFRSPHEIGLNTRAGKLMLCCSVVDCDSFYECLFPNANNENLEINPFAVIFPACTMTLLQTSTTLFEVGNGNERLRTEESTKSSFSHQQQ